MSGKRRSLILTKRQIKTGDNALPLTAFALAFSPVNPLSENDGKTTEFASLNPFSPPLTPSFIVAFATLKVSFPGACPGKDDLLFCRRDNIRLFAKLTLMFSLRATLSFLRYVFAGRKRMCYYKNCVVLRRTATMQRSFVIIMRFRADYESFHSGKTQLSGVFKTKSADICEIPSSGLICNPLILISATFCDILK